MEIFQLTGDYIAEFKASWPCHGLGDLDGIVCAFADNGDLVDLECFDEDDNVIDSHEIDGEALSALTQDCKLHGFEVKAIA